jgi:hypothetical protein
MPRQSATRLVSLATKQLERTHLLIKSVPDPEIRQKVLQINAHRTVKLREATVLYRQRQEKAQASRAAAAACFIELEGLLSRPLDKRAFLAVLEGPTSTPAANSARRLMAALETVRRDIRRAYYAKTQLEGLSLSLQAAPPKLPPARTFAQGSLDT